MLKLLVCCLLFWPTLAQGQSTIDSTGSNLSKEDAQAVLDLHNKIRSDLGIPRLTWSTDIAAFAQQWALSLAQVL
ncbi:MAG: CAP domain-containing protein [Ginsengibacter sp.]